MSEAQQEFQSYDSLGCGNSRGAPRTRSLRVAAISQPFRKHCHFEVATNLPGIKRYRQSSRTCFEGPFGELLRASGSFAVVNPFRFSTKYQDEETGLLYYGYRYYDPRSGRWLTKDPVGDLVFAAAGPDSGRSRIKNEHAHKREGGLYCFVKSSPVNAFDACGLESRLPYECEAATVYIFLKDQQGLEFNAGHLLAQFRAVVAEHEKIYWIVARGGQRPAGSALGLQSTITPGYPCNCFYFLEASVERSDRHGGSATLSAYLDAYGHGRSWKAAADIDAFQWDFDASRDWVPLNWEKRSVGDAWRHFGGFIMAHEIVHAVGVAGHVREENTLMSEPGSWSWLNSNTVPVAKITSRRIKEEILRLKLAMN